MRLQRWLSAAFCSFGFLLVVAACGPDAERREAAEARRGGTVTLVELSDMDKPMPFLYTASGDGNIIDMTYMDLLAARWEDGELLYLTSEEDPTALARSYEFFGPDSASLRYRMRSDVRWSDGQPITAHDAAWTLETMGDPQVASPRQDHLANIRSIEVENDTTLVVHFTHRYPEMLFHTTAVAVAPRHLYEGFDPAQLRNHPALIDPTGGNLVVSGPYMIGDWVRGQRVVLVPNPMFQPQPNIQRIVIRAIPEETTRLIELQTGNLDVMEIPFDKIDLVRREAPHIRFERRERRVYDYIAYNPLAHPALGDRDVRRALGLAIDVEGLIRALYLEDFAEPAGGPYPPIFKRLYDPERQAPVPYDPTEAARLLDARGWAPGPDGIRVKDGRALRFTLTTNAGNQRRADVSQIVQQQWRQIGVDARIQTLESNTFFDRLQKKELEAAIAGWSVGLSADISAVWKGDNPFNYTSFDDPEVNRLFELALAQPTEEAAAPYWREAAGLLVAEQPYTWLFYMDIAVGVNDRIQNTRIDTLSQYQNIHEWWIAGAGEDEPSAGEPGADEPGADEPGADEPGADEPGADEPGADEPGADEPGAGSPDGSGS